MLCSRTLIARTPMVRLPWLIRTLYPYEILPIAQETKEIQDVFFLFYNENICCVYSLESPRRGNFYLEERKNNPQLMPFVSWPGVMINPQLFKLPISRTNFHGPKDVRAIAVRLYVTFYLLSDSCHVFLVVVICCIHVLNRRPGIISHTVPGEPNNGWPESTPHQDDAVLQLEPSGDYLLSGRCIYIGK